MSASAIILGLVQNVISELRGKSSSDWTSEKVAKTIADKVAESIAATIASELRVYANALDLKLATDDLAEAASRLLRSIRDDRPGTSFGALPAEQAKPGETLVDGKWITKEPIE